MPEQTTAAGYDGTAAFGDAGHAGTVGGPAQIAVTVVVAGLPLAGLAVAIWLLWGHGVGVKYVLWIRNK